MQMSLVDWLGACFAMGVPKAVLLGQTNHHPQKRPFPRQAGISILLGNRYSVLFG
jgi:hypothetical protein